MVQWSGATADPVALGRALQRELGIESDEFFEAGADFLEALREGIGDAVRMVVVALRLEPEGEADVLQWSHRLRTIGDPWLRTVGMWLEPEAGS